VPETLLTPGSLVELIGPHQSLDDVAADAGTIAYEILTQLSARYAREYGGALAMRVAVLGGGVIGVTTAWYLLEAGHDVVVIDRQPGPALETSFANAGEISPGYALPWAAPASRPRPVRWLFMHHGPLILKPHADMAMLRWLVAMLGNCNARRYAVNKGRMVRLAEYSRDRLIALRAQTGIA